MQKQSNANSKQEPSSISQNKMIRKCIKSLMHRLLHQYRSQSYDNNKILNQYYQEINKLAELYKNYGEIVNKQSQSTANSNTENEKEENQGNQRLSSISGIQDQTVPYYNPLEHEQLKNLWPEILLFIWQMARSPRQYVQMLKKQQIYAQESQCIDMHVFTTKIYNKVMLQASKITQYTKLFENICADQIYFFLEEISLQICQSFKLGQRIVVNQLNYVTSIVQKSQIINFYLLFKIFKDISYICKHKIMEELQQGLFRFIEIDIVESFALYIIEKYEILDMEMESKETPKEKQPQKIPITERILNSNNVKWREAIRQDGQIGILVQLQDEKQEGKQINYMLMIDDNGQINVVNSNSLNREWKVCKKAQKNYDILNLVKNKKALIEKFRTTSTSAPIRMTLLENVGVVGGSMGKCLAEIDTYDNVGDFAISLSKRTVIGSSFNYLLMQVPLLGYLFVTGGFTYTFYYIFSNKYANINKKMRQLRNITIGSVTSVGSSIVGAMVGQTLIPLPVLGAFIGGMVGGFLGQFSVRTISKILDTARFKQTIQQMKDTIQPQGYWDVNKRTLKIIEINQQKFYQTIPKSLQSKMNCDRIWLTLIFFTIFCFNQSKQRVDAMQKIMKQGKKQEDQRISQDQIIEANQNMNKNIQYEPSLDYMCIIKYFEKNQIIFINFHDEIVQLLNKVFARLK